MNRAKFYQYISENRKQVEWKDGTFEQTCLRKPHEQVVGRIVGANNNGMVEKN